MSAAPIQVDLLDEAPTDCFLATLGVTSGLPPGKYQQIRFILADAGKGAGKGKKKGGGGGGTGPAVNACSSLSSTIYNCIDLGGGKLVPIKLTSEGNTGIKFLRARSRAADSLSAMAKASTSISISTLVSRSSRRGRAATIS